ncbi:hypothetical protein MC885_011218 [Smutsia gigantea]|nr:hypothetical protein MC885_011218 [Smutsia gigantea]
MGKGISKLEPNNDKHSMTTPITTSAPCLSEHPNELHLVIAFFAGVLLTLLLTALVFFIIKSCRKCKWSPRDGTALLSLPLKPELALRRTLHLPYLQHTLPPHPSAQDQRERLLIPAGPYAPPAKLSFPEETLTYASVAFELSEENHNHCTVSHSVDSGHVVYDQVKVARSPSLSKEA